MTVRANGSRPDVGAAFVGYGDAHGFTAVLGAAPGPHRVCAYALDTTSGGATTLGCRLV